MSSITIKRVDKVISKGLILLFLLLLVACTNGNVSEENHQDESEEVNEEDVHEEDVHESGSGDIDSPPLSDQKSLEELPKSELFVSELVPSRIVTTDLEASEAEREILQTLSEFNAIDTESGAMLTLPEDILFDFDADRLRTEASGAISQLVQIIETTGDDVTIVGHTDSHGDDDYNQKLSERRAEAVLQALADAGIEADRLNAEGRGASEPVAKNAHSDGTDYPEGRQKNRRVEVTVHGYSQ